MHSLAPTWAVFLIQCDGLVAPQLHEDHGCGQTCNWLLVGHRVSVGAQRCGKGNTLVLETSQEKEDGRDIIVSAMSTELRPCHALETPVILVNMGKLTDGSRNSMGIILGQKSCPVH